LALLRQGLVEADQNPATAAAAVHGFGVIVAEEYANVLTKSQHAVVRLMYKQRLFQEQLPFVVDSFSKGGAAARTTCLQVLSLLMGAVPKQVRRGREELWYSENGLCLFYKVLLAELPVCLPLVLEALNSNENDVLVSTLKTVTGLLRDAPESLADHTGTLVNRLLQLTTAPAMIIRRAALEALQAMTSLPNYKVWVRGTVTMTLDDYLLCPRSSLLLHKFERLCCQC